VGEGFGDRVVAAAMINRIIHHAEEVTSKGSSYRLRDSRFNYLSSANVVAVEE
jgi:DNA replication protein DnaC